MRVVLLRVGVDSGCGGIQGPLFRDGSFELIPIPDVYCGRGVDRRTYGSTRGRHGRPLIEYFPPRLRRRLRNQSMHVDPEFATFTYGDPTRPKQGLMKLRKDDLLVFYAGLEGFGFESDAGLYIIGFFEVEEAGRARELEKKLGTRQFERFFKKNFHVRHTTVFKDQKKKGLVLVKGGRGSCLLKKAQLISCMGKDRRGRPLKVLSKQMQKYFGGFGGRNSLQRSNPRKVPRMFTERASKFVRGLR